LIDALLNLIFPVQCVLCSGRVLERRWGAACPVCWARLTPVLGPFCTKCGFPAPAISGLCGRCRLGQYHFDFARSALLFNDPLRELVIPHRGFAMAIDEEKQEMYVTIQYPPKIVVYRKGASGSDQPVRVIEGESTRLSDIHGVAIDVKNRLMFVTSWGNVSQYLVPGSGRYELPSITVYPLDANGDKPPLRVIQGPKTQLNWPGAMSLDPEGNLYVANDMDHSILVFRGTDRGDVTPTRVIKGNKTGLSNPIGVFVDAKNQELWAANMGASSATVYPLKGNGNVAPLRTIRTAPADKVSLKWGKPSGLAYDSKREQLLVAN